MKILIFKKKKIVLIFLLLTIQQQLDGSNINLSTETNCLKGEQESFSKKKKKESERTVEPIKKNRKRIIWVRVGLSQMSTHPNCRLAPMSPSPHHTLAIRSLVPSTYSDSKSTFNIVLESIIVLGVSLRSRPFIILT